jgi:serine/threonine protein phosphatase 1
VTRIYAIGDIHGQLDRLAACHRLIAADRDRTGDRSAPVVHLGDLVDRGPDSAGVIAFLMAGPPEWRTILGNHDAMFLRWMADPHDSDPNLNPAYTWLHEKLGGTNTLDSYGVAEGPAMWDRARAQVPQAHLDWLAALPLTVETPDLLFVHAGIRPGVPLTAQDPQDLIWIRRPFLDDTRDHGRLIVHGHTPVGVPTHFGNRVDLDTGAGYGHDLTVAVFEGRDCALLSPFGRIALPPP